MPYRFLDHTADIAFEVASESLEKLFESAAEALTAAMCEPEAIVPREARELAATADSPECALVDWLSELLFQFDAHGFLTRTASATVTQTSGRLEVRGVAHGEPFDPERHQLRVLVKAVTYHGLHVEHADAAWRATVVLDI